eukprot:m.85409 g.85409  ORF g.85409 m.85409 type:complete len:351 (+) comp14844_c2_seq2:749-1801(+)
MDGHVGAKLLGKLSQITVGTDGRKHGVKLLVGFFRFAVVFHQLVVLLKAFFEEINAMFFFLLTPVKLENHFALVDVGVLVHFTNPLFELFTRPGSLSLFLVCRCLQLFLVTKAVASLGFELLSCSQVFLHRSLVLGHLLLALDPRALRLGKGRVCTLVGFVVNQALWKSRLFPVFHRGFKLRLELFPDLEVSICEGASLCEGCSPTVANSAVLVDFDNFFFPSLCPGAERLGVSLFQSSTFGGKLAEFVAQLRPVVNALEHGLVASFVPKIVWFVANGLTASNTKLCRCLVFVAARALHDGRAAGQPIQSKIAKGEVLQVQRCAAQHNTTQRHATPRNTTHTGSVSFLLR